MTAATSERILVVAEFTSATGPNDGRMRVPLTMPRGQAYFWSAAWQRAERESMADFDAGRCFESDDPDAMIRWLDEPDGE